MKRFFTADQLNFISDHVRKDFGYSDKDHFIDITSIAKKSGIDVNEVDFDNPDISGMLITKKGKHVINVNRGDSEERKRFTIAHEVAHLILHSDNKGDHIDYRQALKNYTTEEELTKEIQANMLAAALLMPDELVRNAWRDFKNVDDLADLFKVSKRAAAIRLESLGLIF